MSYLTHGGDDPRPDECRCGIGFCHHHPHLSSIAAKLARRKCYLAGPMRGREIHNFPAFFKAEGELTRAGWEVHSPARMSCEAWFNGEESPGEPGSAEQCRYYAEKDLHVIVKILRAEDGDAVVFLPDSELSTGARSEMATAEWALLPRIPVAEAIKQGGWK